MSVFDFITASVQPDLVGIQLGEPTQSYPRIKHINQLWTLSETLALHRGECIVRFHCYLSVTFLASTLSHLIRRSVDSSLSGPDHDVARLLRLHTHSISGSLASGILVLIPSVCFSYMRLLFAIQRHKPGLDIGLSPSFSTDNLELRKK